MLSVEVSSYRSVLVAAMGFPGLGVRAQHPVIFLYDASDRLFARINFRPNEDLTGVHAVALDTLPYFHVSYPRTDYQLVLDLLRNEKPVYLHLEAEDPAAVTLSTSPEPVGEGEIPF